MTECPVCGGPWEPPNLAAAYQAERPGATVCVAILREIEGAYPGVPTGDLIRRVYGLREPQNPVQSISALICTAINPWLAARGLRIRGAGGVYRMERVER